MTLSDVRCPLVYATGGGGPAAHQPGLQRPVLDLRRPQRHADPADEGAQHRGVRVQPEPPLLLGQGGRDAITRPLLQQLTLREYNPCCCSSVW